MSTHRFIRYYKGVLAILMLTTCIHASQEVPTEEEVAKLYVATFNRAPDSGGLSYWTNSSLTLSKIAQSFFDQEETQLLYPQNTSNTDFIVAVYKNLFNRAPDSLGLIYWEEQLDTNVFSKNSFILAVINGALDSDEVILTNKTTVGISFAQAGLDDVTDAKAIMLSITDDTTSVTTALATFGLSISRCDRVKNSISFAGFSEVAVNCDDTHAYIISNTYPHHDLMNGITGTNEQIPVPALNYSSPIKLSPSLATNLTTIDASVGVAVNGVPIYDYSSQGDLDIYTYNANGDTFVLGQLDNCGGHAGRGDDYHYHKSPNCMIATMANKGDDAIIGWGYDGYPLYGNNNPDGTVINQGDLDVCNAQADATFGYRYHTSVNAPYIIQCLIGEVDTSILPRVAPLSGDSGGIRADLTPPQDGVENLTHTIAVNGTRTMSYTYKSSNYYVTYSPSATETNCYDFEQKTVSNGGIIEKGTFCRDTETSKRP